MGERKFVQMVQVTLPVWPPCPYIVKTLKYLLRNQKADHLETWYAALGTQVYQVYSNDDPWLTMTYFMEGQIWCLMFLYGKKLKQWIFLKQLQSVISQLGDKSTKWVHEAL